MAPPGVPQRDGQQHGGPPELPPKKGFPTALVVIAGFLVMVGVGAYVYKSVAGSSFGLMFHDGERDIAEMEAKNLACDAYTNWRRKLRKQCPSSLDELTRFTNKKDVIDPWGDPYIMLCGDLKPRAAGVCIGVRSNGPNRKPNTSDDVNSWDDDDDRR